MAYYLRQDKKKKELICRCMKVTGTKKKAASFKKYRKLWICLQSYFNEIPDPVSYYQKYVEKEQRTRRLCC